MLFQSSLDFVAFEETSPIWHMGAESYRLLSFLNVFHFSNDSRVNLVTADNDASWK